jgi:hypothetical protein
MRLFGRSLDRLITFRVVTVCLCGQADSDVRLFARSFVRLIAYLLVRLEWSTRQNRRKNCINRASHALPIVLLEYSPSSSVVYISSIAARRTSSDAHLIPSRLFNMAYQTLWKKLSATQLNIAIQVFSLIAIFFEGYDQGVMGGVNASPDYVREVKIGLDDGTITNETKMGGIVSVVCYNVSKFPLIIADCFSTI